MFGSRVAVCMRYVRCFVSVMIRLFAVYVFMSFRIPFVSVMFVVLSV